MKKRCATCDYWYEDAKQCRKKAPNSEGRKWANAASDDWCGEWFNEEYYLKMSTKSSFTKRKD